jgi:hypothetical protein
MRQACVHQSEITHPYPNFLFRDRWGTPSFPPVTLQMLIYELGVGAGNEVGRLKKMLCIERLPA